eukprot:1194265-Prorocentrum_minimum.AAC.3
MATVPRHARRRATVSWLFCRSVRCGVERGYAPLHLVDFQQGCEYSRRGCLRRGGGVAIKRVFKKGRWCCNQEGVSAESVFSQSRKGTRAHRGLSKD